MSKYYEFELTVAGVNYSDIELLKTHATEIMEAKAEVSHEDHKSIALVTRLFLGGGRREDTYCAQLHLRVWELLKRNDVEVSVEAIYLEDNPRETYCFDYTEVGVVLNV